MVLLLASFTFALEVHIYDGEGFEIDSFGTGQEVVVRAVSEERPEISIDGQSIDEEKIMEVSDSLYEYKFVPQTKGTYNVEVSAGQESVKTQLFVGTGLNIDWDQVETEFVGEKEVNDTNVSLEDGVKMELEIGGSFISRFIDWLKNEVGDRIE